MQQQNMRGVQEIINLDLHIFVVSKKVGFQRCCSDCWCQFQSLAHLWQAMMCQVKIVGNKSKCSYLFLESYHDIISRLWSWAILRVHCQNAVICWDKQRSIQKLIKQLCETHHSFSKYFRFDVQELKRIPTKPHWSKHSHR